MPPLSTLALRYVVWFVGLTVVYGGLVAFAGFPSSLATGVILASAPVADVGLRAARTATRGLALRDWAIIWGMCLGIYAVLSVAGPIVLAATVTEVRDGIMAGAVMRDTALVLLSTGVMMAIFLWIGKRAAGSPRA